jgi:hypothetical protein
MQRTRWGDGTWSYERVMSARSTTAFAGLVEQGAGGLIVAPDGFFGAIRDQLLRPAIGYRRSAKTARSAIPAAPSQIRFRDQSHGYKRAIE